MTLTKFYLSALKAKPDLFTKPISNQLLTLRTDTSAADEFYQELGFKTHPIWKNTTHHLQLSETAYYPLSLD